MKELAYLGLKIIGTENDEEYLIEILAKEKTANQEVEIGYMKVTVLDEEDIKREFKNRLHLEFEQIQEALTSVEYRTKSKPSKKNKENICRRCGEKTEKEELEEYGGFCEYCMSEMDEEAENIELYYQDEDEEYHSFKNFQTLIIEGKVAFLHKIEIHKPFRDKGFGNKAMRSLINYLIKKETDYLLLKPCPFEYKSTHQNFEKKRKELIKFYKQFDFQETIGNLFDEKDLHMCKKLK